MANILDQFLIRRTTDIVSKSLPAKYELVIFVQLSEMQKALYTRYVESNGVQATNSCSSYSAGKLLNEISNMRKICCHPDLVHGQVAAGANGFEDAAGIFSPNHER